MDMRGWEICYKKLYLRYWICPDNIQLIFDKVDTMIYQPRRSGNNRCQWPRWLSFLWVAKYRVNRYQKSTIVLLNDLLMLKELQLVHKNTRSIKIFDLRRTSSGIPDLYLGTWQLWNINCLPVVQDCVVIMMFDQKEWCMALTNQESKLFLAS